MQLGKTVFLAGGLALLLSGCGTEPAPSPKPKSRPAHLVEVAPVRQGALALQLVRTGTLRASREVRIFNQVDGRIERLPYYQGDRVAQGTLLVVLDRTLLAAEQAKAEAQLKQAESDLQRLRGLVREQLVSEEELARARTALQVAQAEARLLRTRLNYT
ncbi:MAG: biotin/lipoyl-binding protein, partial [Anaerolineae bacterium]|nr:biotin/lipoyl-binding protein [Anaerolineae bacterium]